MVSVRPFVIIAEIRGALQNINWDEEFKNIEAMTNAFCSTILTISNEYIPRKTMTFSDTDPPWMTP